MSGSPVEAAPGSIALEWRGPFSFRPDAQNSVFVGQVSSAAGMYLWAVPTPAGLLIQRVGGTEKPFWMRHHEHLQAFERGEYPIHRVASLAAGRRDPLFPGLRGDQRRRELLTSRFHNQRPKLQAHIEGTLSLLAIFLAPLNAGVRVRRRLEDAIIRRVQAGGREASALLEQKRPMGHLHAAEAALSVRSVTDGTLRGLAGEFEA
jgi:hypothetical protein